MKILLERDGQNGWSCTIDVEGTPAEYYIIPSNSLRSYYYADPFSALREALQELGLQTIRNPRDAGRPPL